MFPFNSVLSVIHQEKPAKPTSLDKLNCNNLVVLTTLLWSFWSLYIRNMILWFL